MTARPPIAAMLWENWRLTRVEAAQRFGIGVVAGSAALSMFEAGATFAFWVLVLVHGFFWFSIAKLNGGRFMDGYKPGFPLHLLYTRPVPTAVMVGVAMAYDVISCLTLYLASAALLGAAFGKPLPLLAITPWFVAFHLGCLCVQWSTQNRVAQWVGSVIIGWPFYIWLNLRTTNRLTVEFSLAEYAVLAVICIASVALTIAGVARQRRGDAIVSAPRKEAGSGGYPDWLVSLLRFPCPVSSPTRAQVWFELKTSGLPVITIGLVVAMLIGVLFSGAATFALLRHFAIAIAFLSIPVVLFTLGGNAFGIRRRQGRIYGSAFELTQPYGTTGLVGIKVLVRTTCVLLALAAIVTSLWKSSALLQSWGEWLADGRQDALPNLLKTRGKLGDFFGAMTGFTCFALAVLVSILVASIVTWSAAREALRVRFPRFQRLLAVLMPGWGISVILLALGKRMEILSETVVRTAIVSTIWISGIALVAVSIYLLWRSIAERAFTVGYACCAIALAAAFALAWRVAIPVGDIVAILWFASMILAVIVVAPWALGRVRHA